MTTCEKCRQDKPSEEFLAANNTVRGARTKRAALCRPCRAAKRAYELAYYHNNPKRKAAVIDRASKAKRSKKQIGRELIARAKERPCRDCGVQYPPYVMDLDHVRGTKLFTISNWALGSTNLDRLEQEIAKCDVVCSNCHRIRTHFRTASTIPDTGAAPVTQT